MAKRTTPTLRLRLPFPPSLGKYWRHWRGRFVIGAAGKEFRKNVEAIVMEDFGFHFTGLTCRLAMSIDCVMPDRRKRDIDNVPKAVLDALQHAGVYEDDNQIDKLLVTRVRVEPPGYIDVTIEDFTAATAATEER